MTERQQRRIAALIYLALIGTFLAAWLHALPPNRFRTLRQFEVIARNRMTLSQICETFGPPDRDIGSGTFVYEYDLWDGSKIYLSAPAKNDRWRVSYYNRFTKSHHVIYDPTLDLGK